MNEYLKQPSQQAGVTPTGLLLTLTILGLAAVLVIQIAPTYTEFLGAKRALASAQAAGNTEREIRAAFDRQAEVGYIKSISGKELEVTNRNGIFNASFSYRKVIHLVANVSLQMDYESAAPASGPTRKSLAP